MGTSPTPVSTGGRRPLTGFEWGMVGLIAASWLVIGMKIVADRGGISLSPATWYLVRSSGIAMYLLLWVSFVLGLGLATGTPRGEKRLTTTMVHGFAMSLAFGFLVLHILSLLVDPFVSFGLTQVAVPFTAASAEPWTGFGVIADWLMVLIAASVGAKKRIGHRAWKVLHWLTYPLFVLVLLHGLFAGSDSGTWWGRGMYVVTGAIAAGCLVYRMAAGSRRQPAVADA